MRKSDIRGTVSVSINSDFDIDEDDFYDLMDAVDSLLAGVDWNDQPADDTTKTIINLALAYGQVSVGGSRVDYATSDFIKAVGQHFCITGIEPEYVQMLKGHIKKYAINPTRDAKQLTSAVLNLMTFQDHWLPAVPVQISYVIKLSYGSRTNPAVP